MNRTREHSFTEPFCLTAYIKQFTITTTGTSPGGPPYIIYYSLLQHRFLKKLSFYEHTLC